jgi:hypothetical protein
MTSTTQESLRENADAECLRLRSSAGLFEPFIRAEGIRWRGGVGNVPLTFELTFENPHSHATKETPAVLRAADFGAFRPWTPLRTLLIPPIEPRSRYTLEVGAEPEQGSARPRRNLANFLRTLVYERVDARDELGKALAGDRHAHFVGNFDLRVGRQQPVERHCGDLEGLQANCANVTLFRVGDGQRDTYGFRVAECEPGWKVTLWSEECADLHEGATIDSEGSPVLVSITPAPDAVCGEVSIAVHRVGTGESALVEFKLKTRSPGVNERLPLGRRRG